MLSTIESLLTYTNTPLATTAADTRPDAIARTFTLFSALFFYVRIFIYQYYSMHHNI